MSKVVVNDLIISSLETIMAFGINGGAHRFTLDELQNATIANSQDNTALTGKGGRTIGQLKRNKSVTVSGTNGMVSMGLVEVEVGSVGEHKTSTPVKVPDYLVVTGNKATTSYKAVGTAGNEIQEVIVKNSDGTINKRLTQDATAAEGKFAYDPATKELTFADGEIDDATSIVCITLATLRAMLSAIFLITILRLLRCTLTHWQRISVRIFITSSSTFLMLILLVRLILLLVIVRLLMALRLPVLRPLVLTVALSFGI